jgi:predicted Zn finger-like uncharacterized protein
MLVSKLSCPKCKTVLRPAKPLPAGKKVKCPKCGTDFMAEQGDADKQPGVKDLAEAAVAAKKAKSAGKKANAKKPLDDEEDSAGVYSIVAADRPKTEDDEDGEEEGEGKVNFVPDHSIKDLRGPAQKIVIKPSNLLLANGVVGFFGWVILFIILIIPVVFPAIEDTGEDKDQPKPTLPIVTQGLSALANSGQGQQLVMPKEENKVSLYKVYIWDLSAIANFQFFIFALCLSPIFLGIAYAMVMTYGAVQMQSLQSRTWGIVSAIMCMFPFATFGFVIVCSMVISVVVSMLSDDKLAVLVALIGFVVAEVLGCIGIGVLNLLALNRKEVIDGFNYVPDY